MHGKGTPTIEDVPVDARPEHQPTPSSNVAGLAEHEQGRLPPGAT